MTRRSVPAWRPCCPAGGCEVVTALGLEELQQKVSIARAGLDILIADYHLDNGATGDDLVREVLSLRTDQPPVLMITANYSNELKQEVKARGYLLMHKPVKPLKLKATLAHLLLSRGQPAWQRGGD